MYFYKILLKNRDNESRNKTKQFIEEQISKKTKENIDAIKKRYLNNQTQQKLITKTEPIKAFAMTGIKNIPGQVRKNTLKRNNSKTNNKSPLNDLRKAQEKVRRMSEKPKEINKTYYGCPCGYEHSARSGTRSKCDSLRKEIGKVKNQPEKAPFKEISCNTKAETGTKIVMNIKKNGTNIKKVIELKEFLKIVQKHVLVCPYLAAVLSKH